MSFSLADMRYFSLGDSTLLICLIYEVFLLFPMGIFFSTKITATDMTVVTPIAKATFSWSNRYMNAQ